MGRYLFSGKAVVVETGWGELIDDFLQRCRNKNLSPRTIGLYEEKLSHFAKWMRVDPESAKAQDLSDFLAYRRTTGAGGDTIDCFYRVIKTLVRHSRREGRLVNDPLAGLERPQRVERQPVAFTAGAFEKVRTGLDPRNVLDLRDLSLLLFIADSGARLSEALGLDLQRLGLEAGTALVLGKGGKERTVYYGQATRGWLLRWLRRRGELPSPAVWVSRKGDRLSGVGFSQRLKKHTQAAGVAQFRLGAHALRHFFALEWMRNGGGELALQRQLGHTTLNMTRRYATLADADIERMRQTASPVDRLLGGPKRVVLK